MTAPVINDTPGTEYFVQDSGSDFLEGDIYDVPPINEVAEEAQENYDLMDDYSIYDEDENTVDEFNLPAEWNTWSEQRRNGLERAVHAAIMSFKKPGGGDDNLPESDDDFAALAIEALKSCPAATLRGKMYNASDYVAWGDIAEMVALSREEVERANFIEKAVSKVLGRVPTSQSAVSQARSVAYFTCNNVMTRIWENITSGATSDEDISFDDNFEEELASAI
mgnify:FL=1